MTDKERLNYIKEELEAIVKEMDPKLAEMVFIQGCLKDLVRVSNGKKPKRS